MKTEFKCVCCPRGCRISAAADEKSGKTEVRGNLCAAGAELARKKLKTGEVG